MLVMHVSYPIRPSVDKLARRGHHGAHAGAWYAHAHAEPVMLAKLRCHVAKAVVLWVL